MKMKNNILYMMMVLAISLFSLSSCDDFLDETPDSRTDIDNETKVIKILVEGYPRTAYIQINELMSDNHDNYREDNPNTSRYYDEVWNWKDVTETNNEAPQNIWSDGYQAYAGLTVISC